jgi:ParB-like chromosome segregation protein Spo0J
MTDDENAQPLSRYQVFEPLSDEAYAALKRDIEKNGIRVPIEVDEEGESLDGHNRAAIAVDLGIECPKVVQEE